MTTHARHFFRYPEEAASSPTRARGGTTVPATHGPGGIGGDVPAHRPRCSSWPCSVGSWGGEASAACWSRGLAALVLFGVVNRWEPSVLSAVAMAGLTLSTPPWAAGRRASHSRSGGHRAGAGRPSAGPLARLPALGRSVCGIALFSAVISARLPGPRPVGQRPWRHSRRPVLGPMGIDCPARWSSLPRASWSPPRPDGPLPGNRSPPHGRRRFGAGPSALLRRWPSARSGSD